MVIEEYVGKDTEVTIPATIKTFPVVKILSRNGGGYSGMFPDFVTKVNLPDGLKIIGESAFCDSALESITIPDSVKTIGELAFSNCKNLKTVILGNGLKEGGIS